MPKLLSSVGPTSLMLHGVPARATVPELLQRLAELGFDLGCFDFVYLPRRCQATRFGTNYGYAFLRTATPEIAAALCIAAREGTLCFGAVQQSAACSVAREPVDLAKAQQAASSDVPLAFVRHGQQWRCVQWGKSETRAEQLQLLRPSSRLAGSADVSKWLLGGRP